MTWVSRDFPAGYNRDDSLAWHIVVFAVCCIVCLLKYRPHTLYIMPLYKLSAADLPLYLAWFNRHSINGELAPCVIRGILEQTGRSPSDEEIQQVINSISINNTGINCQSYIDFVSSYHELRNPNSEYKAAFQIYDTKGDGHLTKDDLKMMFAQMHLPMNVDDLMDEADADKSGTIEFEEFVALMERKY